MAGNSNSKLKLLRIMDILLEKTDEDHPMSSSEICAELQMYGINAERKSIYSDLDVLTDYGVDIIKTSAPKKGVYIGEREYQIAEVRLLIDAVQSAKFITESKTEELIKKIENNLSRSQVAALSKQVYVDHRNKNANEKIYYAIDSLSHAVETETKVRIHYIKRKIEAGERPKNEDHIYVVSPYALIWSEDHYYLVCNNNKYDNLMHLRIDKISSVAVLSEPARPFSEVSKYKDKFDAADYSSKVFNMFSGEPLNVELCCKNELWEVIRDRFGEDVRITERTNDTFTIVTSAAISGGLVSWILSYSDGIVVVGPKTLKDRVIENAEKTLRAYRG